MNKIKFVFFYRALIRKYLSGNKNVPRGTFLGQGLSKKIVSRETLIKGQDCLRI